MGFYGFRLPDDFLIGTAHSAFQSEGACERDGKSESIMEYYAKQAAGKPAYSERKTLPGELATVYSSELPDRGCFFYDHYEEYIEEMQKTGQNTYRLSIAWPRILPNGTGEVNQKGIDFYNKVFDKMLACGITPFVDLHHWDLPQCLMERGGFESPDFPAWFEAYAKVCFEAFGDRVKMWSTFNELQLSIHNGYALQTFPPFIKDLARSLQAAHNCILAHYRAVRLYKSMKLGGKIGCVNCITDITPARCCEEDVRATELALERQFGWWVAPMMEGKYPQVVLDEIELYRDNMPKNFQQDLDRWFVPMDFIGINYYVSGRTQYDASLPLKCHSVESFYSAPGQPFLPYPAGLFDVVQLIAERYHNPEMYITENGCCLPNIHDEEKETNDPERITYLREHLRMCVRAIRAGYNLKGYYYWNDADSYEELNGYNLRFGLTWVDHETGKHVWKKSRYYFSSICKSHLID